MKGIIVDIQPKALRTTYTPLTHQFGINVVGGGSTSQFYYTNANQFIPNRKLIPLKIKPFLYIVDPDGIIGNGDKSSQITVSYYENTITKPISSGADYTVNADGSLSIFKNIPVSAPVQIICQAIFIDSRNGKSIVLEDQVTLDSTAKSDERVTISIDKDVVIYYNPVTDNPMVDITATGYLGGKEIPLANCAFWWYKVEGNKEKLIGTDILDIEYVSGQYTRSLKLDARNVDTSIYRCRMAYYTGAKPASPSDDKVVAETTLKWKFPPGLWGDVYSPMGQAIRQGMDKMTFTCRMFSNNNEIKDVGKYFFVRWYKKSTAAGSNPIEVGHGVSITLLASELRTVGGAQMRVYPVVMAHGAYKPLTTSTGELLTDKNGNILIGF